MALPTLKPYYVTRACSRGGGGPDSTRVRRMAERRMQNEERYQQWSENNRYFKTTEVNSQKQREWTSDTCFEDSMSACRKNIDKELRAKRLQERQDKLRELLDKENHQFEIELKSLSPDKKREMKERADELRSAREELRKQLADEKLREHWVSNCPELRELQSRQMERRAHEEWECQKERKKQLGEQERIEKEQYEMKLEQQRLEAVRFEQDEKERKKKAEEDIAQQLRKQMLEIKSREEEAILLEHEQALLLREKLALEKAEEQRKQLEQKQRQQEIGRRLIKQAKSQLRRRCQQIQESLELDLQILEELAAKEEEEKIAITARHAAERANAQYMRDIMMKQLELERQREAELEIIYQEEASKLWSKREAEWERERCARESLMAEVLAERQLQLQEKMSVLKSQQLENIEKRDELLKDMELANQLTSRENKRKIEEQKQTRLTLQSQISERKKREGMAELERENELYHQKLLDEEYNARVREEAAIITARNQPRYHPKPKPQYAWY